MPSADWFIIGNQVEILKNLDGSDGLDDDFRIEMIDAGIIPVQPARPSSS